MRGRASGLRHARVRMDRVELLLGLIIRVPVLRLVVLLEGPLGEEDDL